LVLDADALNAIASDTSLQHLLAARLPHGKGTVLTPHPLEAARLLNINTSAVQANRLAAAQQIAGRDRRHAGAVAPHGARPGAR
jgi:NAD(P)H-hydrate repair Nnr-like enzyme with NAD(P)H-hydrate dehydratase domain